MRHYFLFLGLFLIIGCAQSEIQKQADWTASMRGMADSYNKIFPYIYDDKEFKKPNNQFLIKTELQKLSTHAKQLSQSTAKDISGNDPFFKLGLVGLQRTTGKALATYEARSFDYSQLLTQSSIHYCFKCHSRTNVGPSLVQWSNFKLPKNVDAITKIRALVSSRQFIKAAEVADKYLFTSKFEKEWQVMKALKLRLIIALRQHEDPTEALKVVKRMQKSRHSSKLTKESREMISAWEQALKAWEKNNKTGRYLTVEGVLAKEPYLGHKPEFNFVTFLRESTVLHKGLGQIRTPEDRAKAYFRLGLIYVKLRELGFWELPEYYFEACIRAYPQTQLSKRCYYQLEEKVSRDNSKGPEVIIPRREKNYLRQLYLMTERSGRPLTSGGGYDYDN